MELSIIILNYNVRFFLELCLQSVEQSIQNLHAEIIVVDNNSPDDSCAMVKRKFPNVTLIENTKNVGFAKGNNQAVHIAKGKYICVLNPDTVVTERTLVECLKKAMSNPNLGLIGVQLLDGKGFFLKESKRNLPTPKVSLLKLFGNRFSSLSPYYANHIAKDKEGEVSVLVGAFMFVEKIKYNEVKGFDERYFMYGEDIDLSYSMEKAGYKNYYLGQEKIIHFKGESSFKDKIYRERFFGAMKLFYKKNFDSSFVLDGLVSLGIRMASLLSTIKKENSKKINFSKIVLISNDLKLYNKIDLAWQLPSEITSVKEFNDLKLKEDSVQCFLDMNYMTYSEVVQLVEKNKNKKINFRFLLKSSQFAVGSDSSNGLGIVISY